MYQTVASAQLQFPDYHVALDATSSQSAINVYLLPWRGICLPVFSCLQGHLYTDCVVHLPSRGQSILLMS